MMRSGRHLLVFLSALGFGMFGYAMRREGSSHSGPQFIDGLGWNRPQSTGELARKQVGDNSSSRYDELFQRLINTIRYRLYVAKEICPDKAKKHLLRDKDHLLQEFSDGHKLTMLCNAIQELEAEDIKELFEILEVGNKEDGAELLFEIFNVDRNKLNSSSRYDDLFQRLINTIRYRLYVAKEICPDKAKKHLLRDKDHLLQEFSDGHKLTMLCNAIQELEAEDIKELFEILEVGNKEDGAELLFEIFDVDRNKLNSEKLENRQQVMHYTLQINWT